jgi:hypothetical protein
MKTKAFSTRRSFLGAGAALSAPLALAAHDASSTENRRTLEARLAALEDADAIRKLQRSYLQHVNARTHAAAAQLFANPDTARFDASIGALSADAAGDASAIEIAADRETATARMHCTARIDAPIEAPACTLLDMARLQGEGVVRRTERRVLEQAFVRRGGVWKIVRTSYELPARNR